VPINYSNIIYRLIANHKELLATRNNITIIRPITPIEGTVETIDVANIKKGIKTKEAIKEDIIKTINTKHLIKNVIIFIRSQATS
jgi:hypothetical protein